MQLVGALGSTPRRAVVAYTNMDLVNSFDREDVLQCV